MDAPSPDDAQRFCDVATETVQRLLCGRLVRGGVSTSRPDWFFQCEVGAVERYRGGTQVRMRTWRHWSAAHVQFDGDTGDVLHRCIDRLADPPTTAMLTQADALAAAHAAVVVPRDARLTAFRHELFAPGRMVTRLEWEHVHEGLRVEGDCLCVLLHPETRRVVAVTKRWRTVAAGVTVRKGG